MRPRRLSQRPAMALAHYRTLPYPQGQAAKKIGADQVPLMTGDALPRRKPQDTCNSALAKVAICVLTPNKI